jgi:hypothetical protein
MPESDNRNVLHIGSAPRAGHPEITLAVADTVRARIRNAGGTLTVWTVLREDVYETKFGDGFYLHVRGIALNSSDAQILADLASDSQWVKWHVKSYRLGLKDGFPILLQSWPKEEEFTLDQFVAILAEIGPSATASKLHTGTGLRKDGPFIALPEK